MRKEVNLKRGKKSNQRVKKVVTNLIFQSVLDL
ncbi:MAG: hypothetical protein HeimC2_37400 [Candidatus Heimdallarchaeota archaeon LC_2]|nr:MAG: hypothetical protein HeimC2_37400 [Candidatus Heimdallarchaeota archaeon LC_2]